MAKFQSPRAITRPKLIGLERNVNLICNLSLYTHIPNIKLISQSIAKRVATTVLFRNYRMMDMGNTICSGHLVAGTYKFYKEKVVLYDRWPLKRGSIHIKFSKTGQEKVTFKRWLLNRGDCMARFDCNDLIHVDLKFISFTLLVIIINIKKTKTATDNCQITWSVSINKQNIILTRALLTLGKNYKWSLEQTF